MERHLKTRDASCKVCLCCSAVAGAFVSGPEQTKPDCADVCQLYVTVRDPCDAR